MYFEMYQEQSTGSGLISRSSTVGQWRWRLKAENREPISSGESYINKADCLHAIALLKSTNATTPVKET